MRVTAPLPFINMADIQELLALAFAQSQGIAVERQKLVQGVRAPPAGGEIFAVPFEDGRDLQFAVVPAVAVAVL